MQFHFYFTRFRWLSGSKENRFQEISDLVISYSRPSFYLSSIKIIGQMRLHWHIAFFLVLALSTNSGFAQQQLEDVIYLKDGSIYRGVIIEEVPGQNRKIRIMGGSVVSVQEEMIFKR